MALEAKSLRQRSRNGSLMVTLATLLIAAAVLGHLRSLQHQAAGRLPSARRRRMTIQAAPRLPSASLRSSARVADDLGCKRMLWLAGLQFKTAGGEEAHYITASTSYLRYYAAALRSARKNAPSLLPVLVAVNGLPQEYVRWAEEQGALVVEHQVSFERRMAAAKKHDLQTNLMASFARLDIPAIMDKVTAALPAYQARQLGADEAATSLVPEEVDLETVMWTDPDVLFRKDIDSCSLPKPPLLSIGPELRPATIINCGVMLFDVKAWAATLPTMLDFADAIDWSFEHDQDLVTRFFNSPAAAPWREPWHRLTGLPDAYNYKPYWGEPQGGWMGMFTQQVSEVVIVHTHGPKPEMSLCVIDWLKRHVRKPQGWRPQHILHRQDEVVAQCGIDVVIFLGEVLEIMGGAFKSDGGALYRWVLREQDTLCPGLCWAPDSELPGQ